MGHWGWRPLVFGLFISAWVVGCNIVTDNTAPSAAPSISPLVTLTVGRLPTARVSAAPTRAAPSPQPPREASSPTPQEYVVQPGDTLAGVAAQFSISVTALQNANPNAATLTPGQTLLIPAPPALTVYAPTCYETRFDSLLCLGRVENPLDTPVENVAVEVRLLHADESVAMSQRATIEQVSIPAGSFAPYQATFRAGEGDFSRADAHLIGAISGDPERFVMLVIEDVQGEAGDGRVIVRAVIYNPGAQNAELLRVFVTLLDNPGQVIGYRVVPFEDGVILDAGANLPLEIELTPQVIDVTPEYVLYVEARAVAPSSD
jgi:LysM repeat protein